MRLLFAIPHFFKALDPRATNRSHRGEARDERLRALVATIASLHQSFGTGIYGLDHFERVAWPAGGSSRHSVQVIVCTTGDAHLLGSVPASMRPFFQHCPTTAEPMMLGFECHKLLRDAAGQHDYYGYVEDDIVIRDPLFIRKRMLFDNRFGPAALLQPNRYELKADGPVQKLYVDWNLAPARTAGYQDVKDRPRLAMPFAGETIVFERTSYPSAGCFFLSAAQLAIWTASPGFLDGDVSFLSPLDSAATLSVMKAFRIYKPSLDHAWFLELLHASPRWIGSAAQQVRLMPSPGNTEGRLAGSAGPAAQ